MTLLSRIRKRTFLPLLSTLVLSLSVWVGVSLVQQRQLHKKAQAQQVTQITYKSSSEDFANPGRGFMKQSSVYLNQPFSSSKVERKDPSDSVVWIYFRLDNYRYEDGKLRPLEPIGSGRGLDVVKSTFNAARQKGMKLVIRFIYNPGPGSTSDPNKANPDVPLHVALHHINQLKPVIAANSDVLAALQVGFVGHWGEWHSSKYMQPLDIRKKLLDGVLSMVPNDRMVQLRYPRYKQRFYGGPVTDSQAFNKSPVARIGHYNDAFLRDDKDGGTFKSNAQGINVSSYCDNYPGGEVKCWRDYINKDSRFLPVGGEAGSQSSTPSKFADCSNALLQLSNMHWSFLNNGFSKVVLNHWVKQGCMPEIRRRLGYRFVLSKLNVSRQVAPGGKMTFRLELRNEGFASPYNPRPAILVLKEKKTGNQREIPLTSVDPRRWLPGKVINVDVQVPIPGNLPQGTYNLYLWFPDASQSIRTRPDYAIRLANQNVWQSASGFNLLFDNLIVSGSPVSPPPSTPTPTKPPTPPPTLPGDIDKDGDVDIFDYNLIIQHFGNTSCGNVADINSDCKVDIFDYNILIENFGKKG